MNLKLTPEAAKGLRSRVYRSVLGGLLVMLTVGHQFIGAELDTYVAGLHLPAGLAIPSGFGIVAALLAWLGGVLGRNPKTTLFDGLLDTLRGKAPADAIDHSADREALASTMTQQYAQDPNVEFTDAPPDPVGPHGTNEPGETDGAPSPFGENG